MAYEVWSVVFGEQPSADKWNKLGSNDAYFYSAIGATAEWQNYTPAFTATSSNPNVGNGDLLGRYRQIGTTVEGNVLIYMGSSGSSSGSGEYRVSLPVSISADSFWSTRNGSGMGHVVGNCYLRNLGVKTYIGVGRINTEPTAALGDNLVFTLDGYGGWSHNSPFTFASGDNFQCNFRYESV